MNQSDAFFCVIIGIYMKYLITIILISALGFVFIKISDFSSSDQPEIIVPVENPDNVIGYINKNISNLSPEKEVLGGTFYIKNITADAGTGTVSYEDGHNAFTADFTYEFSQSGEVKITSFEIVE